MQSRSILLVLVMLTLVELAVPTGALQTPAAAQVDTDTIIQETSNQLEQEIEQEIEQEAEQDQEQTQSNDQSANQSNTADVSQDETNDQANVLDTGDNTASTTQVGDNDAVGNKVQAESEGGDAGDTEAEKYSEASSTGGDAEAALEQDVDNTATTIQDSSADDNVQTNNNEFGDDVAIVDQDNIADQDALNVAIQDQDLTQNIDQVQEAENFNFDLDFQQAFQQQPDGLVHEDRPPGPVDGGDGDGEGRVLLCHDPPAAHNNFRLRVPESAVPGHLGHGDRIITDPENDPCPQHTGQSPRHG
jgi:hypothetical protein